ncbi:hypothetical protein H0H93_015527 [Arthromyces matolae]|nr:hypothetical protein H0H93_015527 [Arthromyces matolae]
MEYPSPALSNASPSLGYARQPLPAPMNDFPQLEPSIGPTRHRDHGASSRRQALNQKVLGRSSSLSRPNSVGYPRVMTANHDDQHAPLRHGRPSLSIPSPVMPQQAYDPMTPSSTPSPYVRPFDSSSGSRALSLHLPRASSPALSTASAFTDDTTASRAHDIDLKSTNDPTTSTERLQKPRGKKRHLEDADRKAICLYHQEHPQERQEDIGKEFDVERSTISKILKQKAKWLNIPDNPGVRVSKHRPSKFPEIEEELRKWVEQCTSRKMAISDNSIREKAKAVARSLGTPPEKFKASSGWIENFKMRQNIRGGIWLGPEKDKTTARVISDDVSTSSSPVPGTLIITPLNTSYVSDRAPLEPMSPQRDNDMESPSSPVTDELDHRHEQHVSATPVMSSHTPWSTTSADVPPAQPSPLSAHSHHGSGLSTVVGTSSSQPGSYLPQSYYTPPPPISQHPSTAAEAEAHLDVLCNFIDYHAPEEMLTQQQRELLQTIKHQFFRLAHGLPLAQS